jgi:hypothetical protein
MLCTLFERASAGIDAARVPGVRPPPIFCPRTGTSEVKTVKDTIRRTRRWMKDVGKWLVEPEPRRCIPFVVVACVLFAIALIVPRLGSIASERVVRLSGLVFELFGIYTVVAGLRGKRRLFNRPSLTQDLGSWLGRWPRWQRSFTLHASVGTILAGSEVAGRLTLWHSVPPGESLERRFRAVEANLATLRADQERQEKAMDEAQRVTAAAVEAERRARTSALEELQRQLEHLGVKGINVEWAGVIYLFVGTCLSTTSQEIALVLRGLM